MGRPQSQPFRGFLDMMSEMERMRTLGRTGSDPTHETGARTQQPPGARPPGLEEHYGFELPEANVFVLPDPTVYGAVDAGQKCNFGSVFATSGYIPELDVELLEDDEDFFAAYNPSLTMRAETLDRYPDLKPLFEDIAERLDTDTLRRLDAAVLVDQRSAEDVAQEWMQEQGLID